jgi:hypothetical protein
VKPLRTQPSINPLVANSAKHHDHLSPFSATSCIARKFMRAMHGKEQE